MRGSSWSWSSDHSPRTRPPPWLAPPLLPRLPYATNRGPLPAAMARLQPGRGREGGLSGSWEPPLWAEEAEEEGRGLGSCPHYLQDFNFYPIWGNLPLFPDHWFRERVEVIVTESYKVLVFFQLRWQHSVDRSVTECLSRICQSSHTCPSSPATSKIQPPFKQNCSLSKIFWEQNPGHHKCAGNLHKYSSQRWFMGHQKYFTNLEINE